MLRAPVQCGNCSGDLRTVSLNTAESSACPACYKQVHGYVYPAWYRPRSATSLQQNAEEGDASCFFHENKKAATACSACGKFVCSLCDIEYSGDHYCPDCIGQGKSKGVNLDNKARRYDRLALILSVAPILTIYFSFLAPITAGISLYLTFRYWNSKETIVPFNRWRFVVAGILSTLQLIGLVALIIGLSTQ